MPTELRTVQMKMRQSVLDQVEELKELLDTNNRSQIIAMSIALKSTLLKKKAKGAKLMLNYPKKNKTVEIEILGT